MEPPSTLPWAGAFGPAFAEAGRHVAALHRAAAAALRVDDTGRVAADAAALDAAIAQFSADDRVRRQLRGHAEALIADGAAMVPPGELGTPAPIPWATIEHLLTIGSPLASRLLLHHALAGASIRPAELAELLPTQFPNVPPRLTTPPRLVTLAMMNNEIDIGDGGGGRWGGSGGGSGGGSTPPSGGTTWGELQPVADVVDCFAQGDWSLNIWGFSVCLDYFCALKVFKALRSVALFALPGPKGIAPGAWAVLVLKLGEAATLAMAIIWLYALVLSYNIEWVMTGKGVCIGANWPSPLLGTYVFAYPR